MTFFPFSQPYSSNLIATGHFVQKASTSHAQALETLFQNFDFDFERVSSSIDSILTAPTRCVETTLYIQGIVGGDAAFLCTNLNRTGDLYVTQCRHQWQLGRNHHCTISIDHPQVDLEHAMIYYDRSQGFGIIDMGSRAGTWVNGRQLRPHQLQRLQDGDLIELGGLRIEFFKELCSEMAELV